MSSQTGVVIDASLRFARSDPALLSYAQESAQRVGMAVDDLLRDAIDRVAAIRAAEQPGKLNLREGRPLLRAI
ncbi:MAG: hypothetical protein M3Z57_09460 [Candidatus Dormibacteraeota bacterium]|nr:hypothetical protein [Candidatus Dormibacteraeota bacterium]